MTFQVRIQNLGKLADATVRVAPLTVLAGVNNTGKSFFSKSLYSVFDAMNVNHVMAQFDRVSRPLRRDLSLLMRAHSDESLFSAPLPPLINEMVAAIRQMESVARACSIEEGEAGSALVDPRQWYGSLREAADVVNAAYTQLRPALDNWANTDSPKMVEHSYDEDFVFVPDFDIGRLRHSLRRHVKRLCDVGRMTAFDFVQSSFRHKVSRNFVRNFQVQGLSDLKGGKGPLIVQVDDVPLLSVEADNVVPQGFPVSALLQLQRRSRVIYLESPALWKLKGALESVRHSPRFMVSDNRLVGVPGYFYDLADAMHEKFAGKVDFPEVLKHLTDDVVRGKISLSDDTRELIFHETGRGSYPLSATSMGITNLGILSMLIEKKVLDKGTFLFIDEPESNLHPEWQVAMTEALYALARGGVNVVVATHSADILKRLQIYAKEEPEQAAELVAVNHFRRDGTVQSGGAEKILDVQEDLSGPFFELYKRGL